MGVIQPNKLVKAGAVVVAIASPFLIQFTGGFEGTRYKTYLDPVGIPTACEGITGEGVVIGKTYTRAQCDALLQSRLEIAGRGVLSCVKVPLNKNQYNAFTDLTYNIGAGAFCKSSIVTNLNQRNYIEACNRISLYNKAGGQVLKGLTTRREAERKLCLTKVTS